MKKIREVGTAILCIIMALGFILTIATLIAYMCRLRGITNADIEWLTQNASVDLEWGTEITGKGNKYSKQKTGIDKYKAIVAGMEDTIEEFCTSALPEKDIYKNIADLYQISFLQESISKTDIDDLNDEVDYVVDFERYLLDEDIPFLYVNLPRAERINYLNGSAEYDECIEKGNRFIEKLVNRDVPVLDICSFDEIIKDFKVDHSSHWYSENALEATSLLAQELNKKYGYQFDLNLFNIENYYDVLQEHEKFAYDIKAAKGYNYKFMGPSKQTSYSMNYNESKVYEGNFLDVLVNNSKAWSLEGPYHSMWLLSNGCYADISNLSKNNNQNKKILVLGDSFSWPVVSYLSQDVGEIAYLHPRYFQGNVENYIKAYDPDLVLIIYLESQAGAENIKAFSSLTE